MISLFPSDTDLLAEEVYLRRVHVGPQQQKFDLFQAHVGLQQQKFDLFQAHVVGQPVNIVLPVDARSARDGFAHLWVTSHPDCHHFFLRVNDYPLCSQRPSGYA